MTHIRLRFSKVRPWMVWYLTMLLQLKRTIRRDKEALESKGLGSVDDHPDRPSPGQPSRDQGGSDEDPPLSPE